MKNINWILIVGLIGAGVLLTRLFTGTSGIHYQMLQGDILTREFMSVFAREPKYIVQKQFQITHSDGVPLPFNVVKFECCQIGGMVKDGQLFIGTINEVDAWSIAGSTQEKVPEIEMPILVHELVHITTRHFATTSVCIDVNNPFWQEKIAYNAEWLYRQMMMLDEDGYFKIRK